MPAPKGTTIQPITKLTEEELKKHFDDRMPYVYELRTDKPIQLMSDLVTHKVTYNFKPTGGKKCETKKEYQEY